MTPGRLWSWFTSAGQWHGDFGIPHRLVEHLGYFGVSLGIAALIAMPLGLLIGHTGRGGFLIISVANFGRSLPTLGLVVLVAVLSPAALNAVIIPLIALAIPPILVNTYQGVRAVDEDIKDAARGMGMRWWQILLRAEAPVALPLILLGLRISAIQVVATATIAAYPGLGGLGRFIIDGLAANDYTQVVGGSIVVVLLAVVVQGAFVALRRLLVSPGLRPQASVSK